MATTIDELTHAEVLDENMRIPISLFGQTLYITLGQLLAVQNILTITEYSPDGLDGHWHAEYAATDNYIRISTDGGNTWGPAINLRDPAAQPSADSLFTWMKFADTANPQTSADIYDKPRDTTTAIGWAYNKPTREESDDPADYTWTRFKGADAKEECRVQEYYAVSESGRMAPVLGWVEVPANDMPAMSKEKPYLWNKERTTYTNGEYRDTTAKVIGRMGEDGTSITGVTDYYLATSKATGVKTTDAGWVTDIEAAQADWGEAKMWLWNYELRMWSDGHTDEVKPHRIARWAKDGTDGTNGQGSVNSYVFCLSEKQPATPTGGSYTSLVPEGWSDGFPADPEDDNFGLSVWMSRRLFTTDGLPPQDPEWTEPTLFGNNSHQQMLYSTADEQPPSPAVDESAWDEEACRDTVWMATRHRVNSIKNPGWSDWSVIRIKGEKPEVTFDRDRQVLLIDGIEASDCLKGDKLTFADLTPEERLTLKGESVTARWSGTSLIINSGGSDLAAVDLKGATGATGATGAKGADGKSVTARWSGTSLIINSGGTDLAAVDLKGAKGSTPLVNADGSITYKESPTSSELLASSENMADSLAKADSALSIANSKASLADVEDEGFVRIRNKSSKVLEYIMLYDTDDGLAISACGYQPGVSYEQCFPIGGGGSAGLTEAQVNTLIKAYASPLSHSHSQYLTSAALANYVTTNTAQTISSLKTITAGLHVSGRVGTSGDGEGIVVGYASNNYAGLCLGEYAGERSVFYKLKGGTPFWRYNNGSSSFDIYHPSKAGTIALTSDIPSLTGYATQSWVNAQGFLTTTSAASTYLPLSGGTITGSINLGPNVFISIKNQSRNLIDYIDTQYDDILNWAQDNFLDLGGGTMTGDIILNNASYVRINGEAGRVCRLYQDGVSVNARPDGGGSVVQFMANNSSGTNLGAAGGVFLNANAVQYFYYGGTWDAPLMKLMPTGQLQATTALIGNLYLAKSGNQPYLYAAQGQIYIQNTTSYIDAESEMWGFQYHTSSDQRLKNVTRHIAPSVFAIASARAVEFDWLRNGRHDCGCIAQDWLDIIPRVVVTDKYTGMLSMDYGKAALISAISIARSVVSHESRIATLERETAQLKADNLRLNNLLQAFINSQNSQKSIAV